MDRTLQDFEDSVIACNLVARVAEQSTESVVLAGADDSRQLIDRLERLVSSVEDKTQELRTAFNKYRHDPSKMAPQLSNMSSAASEISSNLRVINRTLDGVNKA
jgi:ABC-type transporter Mla subunit MlaD